MKTTQKHNKTSKSSLTWKRGENVENNQQYNFRSHTPIIESYKNQTNEISFSTICVSRKSHRIFNNQGKQLSIDNLLHGEHRNTRWKPALSNEWGRLAQGNNTGVEAMDNMSIITYAQVPIERKVTCASFVCNHRPLKDEKWRICLVVRGDKLKYEHDSGSPATDLFETKILSNSVIYDVKSGAKFLSMNLKDMFLHTPMERP